jgi:RimJ/RimL family protein N-acetyltransferase
MGPNTPEETETFLHEARASADVSPRRRYALAVIVQSDAERLIGSIELRVVSCEHRRGEIGYVLARESWGLGYATEATRRLLAFGFNELGLHNCDPRESRFSRRRTVCTRRDFSASTSMLRASGETDSC